MNGLRTGSSSPLVFGSKFDPAMLVRGENELRFCLGDGTMPDDQVVEDLIETTPEDIGRAKDPRAVL